MAPVEFVLVAPDTIIKRNKNEKIEIAVAISHFDRVFLLQFSLVFARWKRRLAHESILTKLAKKMPTAYDRYRQGLIIFAAFLG